MKKMTAEEIIKKHSESDKIIDELSSSDDYKRSNQEAKKLHKLHNYLQENTSLAKEVYGALLKSECVTSRSISAAECLRIGIFIEEAEETLETIGQRDDIGIRSFNAKMALKIWRGEIPGKTL